MGQKVPNAWGLYDMLGNVSEWGHDGKRAYRNTAVDDPEGPTVAAAPRVIRGGSWFTPARGARATNRDWLAPDERIQFIGFRCLSSGVSQAAPEAR